ncbi:sensor histidine kinase [Flavihumibacter sp. UBA7668]|uniref:sensor histidine kinase n=1 Tax=Flavihumibacter sp. UBA7668 TaxID=1946542 RepID=UPI0025BEC0D0|nr:ATP-binding protein [Flavihumibacter sp. UBA7668]
MHDKTTEILLWTITGSLATIISFIIFLNHIITLYNKKNIEFNRQLQFRNLEKEKEILKTRIDVQEETIQKISKELHDNITQLLSLSKLNLNNLQLDISVLNKINISKELITKAISELANISRTLSSETLTDFGLLRTLEVESERVFEINNTKINVVSQFEPTHINGEEQLILYRIFQESIRNSIIHGKATQIDINLFTSTTNLTFEITDNGSGFNVEETNKETKNKHHGLKNIIKRANLLNAECKIISSQGTGTKVIISRNLTSS